MKDIALVGYDKGIKAVSTCNINDSWCSKLQDVAFEGVIAYGCKTIVVIGTTGHQVPVSWCLSLTVISIVGVVMVGKTEHMAELMADSADTIQILMLVGTCLIVLKLYTTCIASEIFAIISHSLPASLLREVKCMGPEIVLVVALYITAVAGKDEIAHIYIAVAVEVVLAEVHLVVNQGNGFLEYGGHCLVACIFAANIG